MMKVVLTTHQFLPDYSSGTEVLTYSVAKELMARGHSVIVFTGYPARVTLSDEQRFDYYEHEGIAVHRFHHAHVPMGQQDVVTEIEHCNLLAAAYFRKLLEDSAPDIVHYFHMSRLGCLLIDVANRLNIPSFYTPTDFWSICPTSQLLLKDGSMCDGPGPRGGNCVKHVAELTRGPAVQRVLAPIPDAVMETLVWVAKQADFIQHPLRKEIVALSNRAGFIADRLNVLDRIIAPTALMYQKLASNGIDVGKLVKSAYGIDTSYYADARRARSLQGRLQIGFIGTLAQHKGCHVLIDAVSRLPAGSCELKIYGSPKDFPDYYAGLQSSAGDHPHIQFCGTFPNAQIGNVLSAIDVLVIPSLWYENTPLVIYSAMASGCPAIVSDYPGMTETVIQDRNGLVFPSGDADALRACLARLIDEPELLAHLSAHCQPPKSIISYVDELLEFYAESLRQPDRVRLLPAASPDIPLPATGKPFSIGGWALPRNGLLKEILLLDADTILDRTHSFGERSDVIAAYGAQNIKCKSGRIGFSLSFAEQLSAQTILRVVTHGGDAVDLPLAMACEGHTTLIGAGIYLGIDRLSLPPFGAGRHPLTNIG